ncbi:MAG: phosphatidylinositol-specific phospholipase C/glycerophosphodiester phosphodiesterase family protein [Cyanobacteria bacterium P01_F01_bin.150]
MLIIHHRRNTLDLLKDTRPEWGVEIDIRSYGDKLVVHHDPFVEAIALEEWLMGYQHGLIILNVKEEGLEDRLLALMDKHNIQDFFFLDQSFPFLIKTARLGESRCAVRVSEYESIETALTLAGMVQWIWVDVFTRFPLTKQDYERLKDAGFRLCLVSPELQSHPPEMLQSLQLELTKQDMIMDAVCTKMPERWIL